MTLTITPERPDTADAQALIAELEGELAPLYPSESCHGYSIERSSRKEWHSFSFEKIVYLPGKEVF